MHLLDNAIQSICVGVEDFKTSRSERMLSSVRNIHAGILLLYKEKLRILSPIDSNEVLVKEKISPVRSSDGSLKFIGKGKNTVNITQIKERLKNLGVHVDWESFDELSEIRNNIEHYYSDAGIDVTREALSKSFVLIRDFIRLNLEEDPLEILGQECWSTLVEIETIFIREQNECISALQSIDWKSAELENIIFKFRCLKCSSLLLMPSNYNGEPLDGIVLSCRSCGEESDFADIAETCLEEHLSYESYRARKDGTDDPLHHCPECFRKSYITDEDKCALCGHTRSYTKCNRCGADLGMLEQDLGGLCEYCNHMYTRILAE
jgi:DNA-directed RNA polymerase subunit RPC12/RpoP